MSPTRTPVPPRAPADSVAENPARPDLDIDFILTQLRGTFEGRLEQLLALPSDDSACAVHSSALDAINAALARIHEGVYGICRACGGPISAARLEVVPTATSCVPCNTGGATP